MAPRRKDTKSPYSNGSESSDRPPTLSAPINSRSMLAGVRVPPNQRPVRFAPREFAGRKKANQNYDGDSYGTPRSKPIPAMTSSVMSRGPNVGGRSAQISAYQWISNVKVGGRREGSSETGSGGNSGNASRIRSQSRTTSLDPTSQAYSRTRDRSLSLDRADEEPIATLQEEITAVVKVLNSPKLKLEKVGCRSGGAWFLCMLNSVQ